MDLAAANSANRDDFVRAFGSIFENSPWVAQSAWRARPFASLEALHAAMVEVVRASPREQQRALLNAHPDLAGKEAQTGAMTQDSVSEQASAGLDRLNADEMAQLSRLNRAYRARFGHPFIIAVRNHTKQSIFESFKQRLEQSADGELETALNEVYKITRLRLDKSFAADKPASV